MLVEVMAALLSSFGFGILFNIKGKKIIFAAIAGALGWFSYKLSLNFGFSEVISLFLAAVTFSIFSEICARILKSPVTTFIICALIPLVPGGGMYYTMVEAISGNALKSLEVALDTLASAGALALGVVLVSTTTRIVSGFKGKRKIGLDNSTNKISV